MEPYLSIVIPAYNEAKRILPTLRDINQKASGFSYPYEILVVNDGSKDDTAMVVNSVLGEVKNLRLIDNKVNKGKGGVCRQGMLEARGAVRLFMDADNSTSIDEFEKLRPWFEKGYDVVIGSRSVRGAQLAVAQPWYRQLPGKVGNIIFQIVLGLWGIWDTQCGFKAFSADAAQAIFSKSKIVGWGFDVELLALGKKLGYRIKEVPIRWVNDPNSHVGASAYLKVLLETFTIRWWLWINSYGLKNP